MVFYKIAIVGLGSIGSKHLINIHKVLKSRNISFSIDLIRSNLNKKIDYEISGLINNIYLLSEEISDDYDVIFITNPTYLHYQTIKTYVSKTKHMFIEKPLFNDSNLSIKELNFNKKGIYYVACPVRYTEVVQYIKNEIDLDTVFSIRVICSSYLPNWRPKMDYRKNYSSHKDQGGGVSIDLIHEWDYIQYLFGKPNKILNLQGQFSDLEIDSEDLSIYIAKYDKMMVEIHLDYFGKKTIREIQLFTSKDTIIADIANSEIRYLCSGKKVVFKENRNDFQLKEIEYFFDIIEGKVKNTNDIETAIRTLRIVRGE